jgi:hypothetical protein
MDTKVHFVGARCKCPNTKVYGRAFSHRKKLNTKRIRVPLFMGHFLNIMGVTYRCVFAHRCVYPRYFSEFW